MIKKVKAETLRLKKRPIEMPKIKTNASGWVKSICSCKVPS